MDDPFSFYYIQKIDDKIHWQMDCRLLSISNDLRFSCIEYCINLFRKIYNDIFHDNDYRDNFERDKEILDLNAEKEALKIQSAEMMADSFAAIKKSPELSMWESYDDETKDIIYRNYKDDVDCLAYYFGDNR